MWPVVASKNTSIQFKICYSVLKILACLSPFKPSLELIVYPQEACHSICS
jgi:hypothetical protein